MGKNNRHQKNLKSEKAKVKLKTKKNSKPLPKGLNVTNTTFKAKKIAIREQLKDHDESEILSRRKLNVKDLLSRLQHHNSKVRQEAVKELKEILFQHSTEILDSQLRSVLQGISALALDRERNIRLDSLKVLSTILSPISNEHLRPFFEVLVSYLRCAMTHIDPNIKEDSLLFLDVLGQNCGALLAKNARKVLPVFLDMISGLRSESRPGRLLVTALNSKNTRVKWRTKVLGTLSSIFLSIVSERKKTDKRNFPSRRVVVTSETRYVPIYKTNNLDIYEFNYGEIATSSDFEELTRYAKVLLPLIIDSWLEVMPKQNTISVPCDREISLEASNLLKNVSELIELVVEYFELLDREHDARERKSGEWLRETFLESFGKNLLDRFPYSHTRSVQRPRKRQQDIELVELKDKCLDQNLSLCYAYVWMLTADRSNKIEGKGSRELFARILDYVNELLGNITNSENAAISRLTKLLRVIFVRGRSILHKSGFSLAETFNSVVEVHARSPPGSKLQSQLSTMFTDIMLNDDSRDLHKDETFKKFATSLPGLLLKNSINENTIRLINRVVLHYPTWIREKLADKEKEIIENAGKIDIIGSEDEKESRLMICNLMYYVDEHVYY